MNKNEIEELIILLDKYNLNKIKIKNKTSFLEISRKNNNTTIKKNSINKNTITNSQTIKSPLVGIFYTKPAPNKPTFVNEGDKIKKGDTICIIEAMKTLHQIKAEHSCTIIKILIKNDTPVEYEQDLFLIQYV